MSMVSHAAGARFYSLLGGAMLSFYDWYADLPVASPQVFGDHVHMLTAPLGYLTRPCIVYRSRDRQLGARAPRRGWERTGV